MSSGLAAGGKWATPLSWWELREFGGMAAQIAQIRVTDGGNLLQAAPAEAGSKVQPGVSKKSGGVWGGAGS